MAVRQEIVDLWKDRNPDIEEAITQVLTEKKPRRGRVVPKGYKLEGSEFVPIPEILEVLMEECYRVRHVKTRSLRECQAVIRPLLEYYGQEIPNPAGMRVVLERIEKDLGLNTTQKEFISKRQKVALEIKEKTGKIPHSKDLKKEFAQLQYDEKKKELEEFRAEAIKTEKKMLKMARKAYKSGDELRNDFYKAKKPEKTIYTPKHPRIDAYLTAVSQNLPKEIVMPLYMEAIKEAESAEQKVAFLPTPKQYDFISASEDIVLYGGAAGGGKSYALLFDAVRYAHMKGYRGVLIRRKMPELRELIDISREIYPAMFGKGTRYNSQEKTWRFPSGAVLEFGFLDAPDDKYQYQGKQYAWIGFDELGLQPTPEGFDYLKSRLRTTLPIQATIRCTANPGSLWVKERFIDPAPPNTTFRDTAGLTYRFIPSLVSDNPYIYEEGQGQYVKMLSSLSEVERRQLLEGDWTVSDDSAFPEFDPKRHVVPEDEFYPPDHWPRFCGVDYGYNDQTAAVWGAVNPMTGQVVIYREFARRGLEGGDAARAILGAARDDLVRVDYVVDHTIWNKTGHLGPTIGEAMQRAGLHMRRADKNREGGKVQIHARLAIDPLTDQPNMVILDCCPRLIRELQSLKRADKRPGQSIEDIQQTRLNGNHNDLYDALRYALMSRPRQQTAEDILLQSKSEAWGRINRLFS